MISTTNHAEDTFYFINKKYTFLSYNICSKE